MVHRFYTVSLAEPGAEMELPPEVARQSFRVLKLRPGERVALFDGAGAEAILTLEEVSAKRVAGRITNLTHPDREAPLQVELVIALPRQEKWEWILQKGTELGAARFQPLQTARCVAHLSHEEWPRKAGRWRKIIQEAAEQSGRTILPALLPPLRLQDLLQQPGGGIVLHTEPHLPPLGSAFAQGVHSSARLLFGPEGGLDDREVETLIQAGWTAASLGQRILRCETAVVAACVVALGVGR